MQKHFRIVLKKIIIRMQFFDIIYHQNLNLVL